MFKFSSHSYRTTFVATGTDITSLVQELPKFQYIEFEAECSDSKTRLFSSLEELLNFKNLRRESISQLQIRTWDSADHWVRIDLECAYGKNARIVLNAQEPSLQKAEQAFKDFLEVTSPWYKIISNNRILYTFIIIFLVGYALIAVGAFIYRTQETVAAFTDHHWPIPVGMAAGLLIGILISYLFPAGTFAIGDGARRNQHKDIFRIALVLGSVASIAAALVLKIIGL